MLIHRQPHPEEPRAARRLEGWATTRVYPTLRDGPAGLLRVRLGPYQQSMKVGTSVGCARFGSCAVAWCRPSAGWAADGADWWRPGHAKARLESLEAPPAQEAVAQDQQRPAVADDRHGARHRARLVLKLVPTHDHALRISLAAV